MSRIKGTKSDSSTPSEDVVEAQKDHLNSESRPIWVPKIESYEGAVPDTRFRRKISSNVITEWLKIGDELIQTQDWEGMRRESVVDATDDPLWLALTRSKPSMVRSDGGVTTAGNPFPGLRALFEGTGFFDTWSSVRSPSGTGRPRVGSFAAMAILSWIRGLMPLQLQFMKSFSHTPIVALGFSRWL